MVDNVTITEGSGTQIAAVAGKTNEIFDVKAIIK